MMREKNIMKSVLIIGMGRFGQHLCKNLSRLGNQVMIVDKSEEKLEELFEYVVSAKVGDCTNIEVLKDLGVRNFDVVFVCIGTNFQSSLEITYLLKELGTKYVVSKASRDIQAKFLLRNGADEVVYPERDIAEHISVRHTSDNIFEYVELTDKYSMFEIKPLESWIGKSLRTLDLRNKYEILVLGYKKGEKVDFMPKADSVIMQDCHMLVIGKQEDISKIINEVGR